MGSNVKLESAWVLNVLVEWRGVLAKLPSGRVVQMAALGNEAQFTWSVDRNTRAVDFGAELPFPRSAAGILGSRLSAVNLSTPAPVATREHLRENAAATSPPRNRVVIMSDTRKYLLREDQIPRSWYNIQADLPSPAAPVLHPGTGQPIGPDDLAPLFPMALIGQEVSQDREIEIPDPGAAISTGPGVPLRSSAPARLERDLDTPARIYYKYEGSEPGRQPQAEHRGRPRPSTTRRRASRASPRRPGPVSGAPHSRTRGLSSGWKSRSTWCE